MRSQPPALEDAVRIRRLSAGEIAAVAPDLAAVLLDCVAGAVMLGAGALLTGPALRLTDRFRGTGGSRTHIVHLPVRHPVPDYQRVPTPRQTEKRTPALH